MEYLIFAVLVFIAYQLNKIYSNSEKKAIENSYIVNTSIANPPAFSEEDWDKAVADWIESETINNIELGTYGKPGYHIWMPRVMMRLNLTRRC